MRWPEKVLDRLEQSLEWQSPGALSWRFHEDENWLRLAPSVVELVGGADDGESVYPFFSLHLSHWIEIFDRRPEMIWNTMGNEFSLEGKINDEDAWVTFSREPFDDEEPQDVLDPNGGIRKKNHRRNEEVRLCLVPFPGRQDSCGSGVR
jgi:hypothetical protein